MRCPRCSAELDTPLLCAACALPVAAERDPTPFAALGIETGFQVDPEDLRARLLRFSRVVHPDYFGTAEPEVRRLAERNSALLNAAFETLSDDARRAHWLVEHLGGPSEAEERQMPQAFLAEVLEWNEMLEDARRSAPGSSEREALATLRGDLDEERRAALGRVADLLTPLPGPGARELGDARKELNALRYLDRTLSQIESLRLEEAAAG